MKAQKTRNATLILLLAAMFGVAPACFGSQTSTEKTTIKEIKQEVADVAEVIKEYSADQRDEAVKKVKDALDDLDARIESIEERIDNEWDQMNQAARQKARATLKDLRKQRNEIAEWYGGLKHSSADAWERMKKGFSDAYTALHAAWEKAKKEFHTDQ